MSEQTLVAAVGLTAPLTSLATSTPKNACIVATISALPTNTYDNGNNGVGATLAATANGLLTIDGIGLVTGMRVLINNETDSSRNGIYDVTQCGSATLPYVLTRSHDFDEPAEIPGASIFIQLGATKGNSIWFLTPISIFTIGITPIKFTQFSLPTEPTGVIKMYGSSTPPSGYLLCDGAAVSRTTYANLFAVIGTTFGVGDGSTTFNVPDIQRRIPIGWKSGDTVGDNDGVAAGSRASSPAHTHTGPSHTHNQKGGMSDPDHDLGAGAGIVAASNFGSPWLNDAGGSISVFNPQMGVDSAGTGDTGSSSPNWIKVPFIIKT